MNLNNKSVDVIYIPESILYESVRKYFYHQDLLKYPEGGYSYGRVTAMQFCIGVASVAGSGAHGAGATLSTGRRSLQPLLGHWSYPGPVPGVRRIRQAWWHGCKQPGKVVLSMPMSCWQYTQAASGSVAPFGAVAEVIAAIRSAERLVSPRAAAKGEMQMGPVAVSDW